MTPGDTSHPERGAPYNSKSSSKISRIITSGVLKRINLKLFLKLKNTKNSR